MTAPRVPFSVNAREKLYPAKDLAMSGRGTSDIPNRVFKQTREWRRDHIRPVFINIQSIPIIDENNFFPGAASLDYVKHVKDLPVS